MARCIIVIVLVMTALCVEAQRFFGSTEKVDTTQANPTDQNGTTTAGHMMGRHHMHMMGMNGTHHGHMMGRHHMHMMGMNGTRNGRHMMGRHHKHMMGMNGTRNGHMMGRHHMHMMNMNGTLNDTLMGNGSQMNMSCCGDMMGRRGMRRRMNGNLNVTNPFSRMVSRQGMGFGNGRDNGMGHGMGNGRGHGMGNGGGHMMGHGMGPGMGGGMGNGGGHMMGHGMGHGGGRMMGHGMGHRRGHMMGRGMGHGGGHMMGRGMGHGGGHMMGRGMGNGMGAGVTPPNPEGAEMSPLQVTTQTEEASVTGSEIDYPDMERMVNPNQNGYDMGGYDMGDPYMGGYYAHPSQVRPVYRPQYGRRRGHHGMGNNGIGGGQPRYRPRVRNMGYGRGRNGDYYSNNK